MGRFLVDEDLPRSLARHLRERGIEADDVRDVGLRGMPDSEIFRFAVESGAALLSADLGFANILAFPTGTHNGIVVARFPNETPVSALNQAIAAALMLLSPQDVSGNLIILEPDRIRLRRKTA
jgi:predicted nuclease of predicted toxin-antitoxin system